MAVFYGLRTEQVLRLRLPARLREGLVGDYWIQDGSGTVLRDWSDYKNHGSINLDRCDWVRNGDKWGLRSKREGTAAAIPHKSFNDISTFEEWTIEIVARVEDWAYWDDTRLIFEPSASLGLLSKGGSSPRLEVANYEGKVRFGTYAVDEEGNPIGWKALFSFSEVSAADIKGHVRWFAYGMKRFKELMFAYQGEVRRTTINWGVEPNTYSLNLFQGWASCYYETIFLIRIWNRLLSDSELRELFSYSMRGV